jgi:hypothetical protein
MDCMRLLWGCTAIRMFSAYGCWIHTVLLIVYPRAFQLCMLYLLSHNAEYVQHKSAYTLTVCCYSFPSLLACTPTIHRLFYTYSRFSPFPFHTSRNLIYIILATPQILQPSTISLTRYSSLALASLPVQVTLRVKCVLRR